MEIVCRSPDHEAAKPLDASAGGWAYRAMRPRRLILATVLVLPVMPALAQGEQQGAARRTGGAIERGAQRTGAAIERGAQRTGAAVERGAQRTGGALHRAGNWTSERFHRFQRWMFGSDG